MPKVRFTQSEYSRLAKSLDAWFIPSPKATPEQKTLVESRLFLLEWCISEDLIPEHLGRMASKNKGFGLSLKRAKAIQELRLLQTGLDAKNPAMPIFLLKNMAGYRDVPLDSKGLQQTLKLVVHLPDKPKPSKQLKQSVDAHFEVIPPARLAPARIDGRSKAARKAKAAASGDPGTEQKPQ
jgi:hypothetical protein